MKHNWDYKSFNQIATTLTPTCKIDKSQYLQVGKIPIISQEEKFISGYWNQLQDQTIIKSPVVIFGDHSRVLKYVDFDFVVGADGVKIIKPCSEINAKFMYHYLKWSNVPSLGYARHYKLIKALMFPVSPMKVQNQIVTELDKINEVIADNREMLKQLNALQQSIFYDTFGDPVNNPMHWGTSKLKDVAPAIPSKLKPLELGGKIWLLNLDQIESNSGNIIQIQFFDKSEVGSSTVSFDTDNVLYSKLRPYLNKVVIPLSNGICTSELIPLRPQKEILNKIYLGFALRLPEFVDYINGKTGGAKMPRVKMPYFWAFELPIPPLPLQEEFAKKVEAIEAQKATIESNIKELQTLLDSRMDYWFN